MRYGKTYGGDDPEMIEGDVFRIIVKVPEFRQIAGSESQSRQFAPEVTPEVKKMLPIIHGEMARGEIQKKLRLKDEKHFREGYQQIGIKMGLIEMTIPDKPKSSKQKYRLTEKDRQVLALIQEGSE